jgi:hypothetical protein
MTSLGVFTIFMILSCRTASLIAAARAAGYDWANEEVLGEDRAEENHIVSQCRHAAARWLFVAGE